MGGNGEGPAGWLFWEGDHEWEAGTIKGVG